MAVPNLQQVVNGGTVQAPDVNQLVMAFLGTYLVNGPFVQIATQSVTTTTASVTFSNIPAYENLMLTWQARSTNASASANLFMQINNDASSLYYDARVFGFNNAASSDRDGGATSCKIGEIAGASASDTGNTGWGCIHLPGWNNTNSFQGYSGTSGYMSGTGASGMAAETWVGCYGSTGTLTSIKLFTTGNFAGTVGSGCVFTLYGSM